ncbi:MAG: tetratricopeptide repeat protein, partial [Candidatus Aenigmarchaeota archaeon]|nr:tetratricopeptide repeat protein [Candidatus Aenigmarchaeota archaeon]
AKNVFLDKLLYGEGDSKRIYHLLLAKYILSQMNDKEQKEYHSRAVEVYRGKLAKAEEEQIRPDALAAMRLAEHVLAAEGKEAFVYAFANDCTKPLVNLGLLDAAIRFSERALGVVEKESEEEAMVTGNLGLIYQTKGDLDQAEEMHKKSLEFNKKLGSLEGMANQYGNLGLTYRKRGELDTAEDMHKKSLEIEKKLGRLEGMADDYGNLGNIYNMRGDLDKAEKMYNKVLKIEEILGRIDSIANAYGNLGLIYMQKGELDKAEDMNNKSLEIEKKLGRLEGMASQYGNLGVIYAQRGDIGKAKEYWEKAVGLYKKIGMPHMVEKVEGLIEGIEN